MFRLLCIQLYLFRFSPYLGAGSDFMPFAQRVGLPCTDHSFIRDKVGYTKQLLVEISFILISLNI